MRLLLLLLGIALAFAACGGDDDELSDKIDALQNDIDLLKAHVGIKAGEPTPETGTVEKQPATGNVPPSARDDVEPPKEELQPVQPLAPPRKGRIAFESEGDIFAIDSDGTNLTNLTNHLAHDSRPDWSSNGNQIAFVSNRHNFDGGGVPKIFVMDPDGNNQKILVDMGDGGIRLDDPEWSPHGGAIVFTTGKGIHIGGNIKPVLLTRGAQPAWSILGQIAFVIGSHITGNDSEDIYVMNPHGGDPVRITDHPRDEYHPAWSPDGRLIAYTTSRVKEHVANHEIFVMNADGTNQINIARHPGDDRAPTWSPDGRQIAFMSDRNESFNWEIYVMNVNGSNQRNITNNANANDLYPSWQPR